METAKRLGYRIGRGTFCTPETQTPDSSSSRQADESYEANNFLLASSVYISPNFTPDVIDLIFLALHFYFYFLLLFAQESDPCPVAIKRIRRRCRWSGQSVSSSSVWPVITQNSYTLNLLNNSTKENDKESSSENSTRHFPPSSHRFYFS